MARIRTIKPEFWDDQTLGKVSPIARLLFIGLWQFADDYGSVVGDPRWIKSKIFAYDDMRSEQLNAYLQSLVEARMIIPVTQGGESYYVIRTFTKHQKVETPNKLRFLSAEILTKVFAEYSTSETAPASFPQNPLRKSSEQSGKNSPDPRKKNLDPSENILEPSENILEPSENILEPSENILEASEKSPSIIGVVIVKEKEIEKEKKKEKTAAPLVLVLDLILFLKNINEKTDCAFETKERNRKVILFLELQSQNAVFLENWEAYAKMRNEIKKPMSYEIGLLLAKKMIKSGRSTTEISDTLEEATAKKWQDMYFQEPAKNTKKAVVDTYTVLPEDEMTRQNRAAGAGIIPNF